MDQVRRRQTDKYDIFILKLVTSTMRPLQDQCEPTPYKDIEALFLRDMGNPISELFEDFDPVPIGVASLAQVHVGRHSATGKKVAVKVRYATIPVERSFDVKDRYNIHTLQNSATLT